MQPKVLAPFAVLLFAVCAVAATPAEASESVRTHYRTPTAPSWDPTQWGPETCQASVIPGPRVECDPRVPPAESLDDDIQVPVWAETWGQFVFTPPTRTVRIEFHDQLVGHPAFKIFFGGTGTGYAQSLTCHTSCTFSLGSHSEFRVHIAADGYAYADLIADSHIGVPPTAGYFEALWL